MGGDEPHATGLIIFPEAIFYRGDIGKNTMGAKERLNFTKDGYGIIQGYSINKQVRIKLPDLLITQKFMSIKEVLQLMFLMVIYTNLKIKAK
jgi:hypothetical protein